MASPQRRTPDGAPPARPGRAGSRAGAGGGGELAEPIAELRRQIAELGDRVAGGGAGAAAPREKRDAIHHVRRFLPFYGLAAVWLLLLVMFPSTTNQGPADDTRDSITGQRGGAAGAENFSTKYADDPASATTDGAAAAVGGGGSGPAGTVRGRSGPASVTGPAGPQPQLADVQVGSGVTRGGFDCAPGVSQIPWSDYASPCIGKYTGTNPGATYRGVTADKIRITRRSFEQASQFAPISAAAGVASEDVIREVRDTFINYFNKVFELYGRQVEFVDYTASSQSSDVEEAQSRGKEGACIDATKVEKELKAFAEAATGWGPYGECLAERKVVHFGAGPYFPETWYRKLHPFIWNGIMECERISYQVAEYMGKRLLGRKAKWAGDAAFQQQNRKFGTYVPNNDEYQHCVNISETDFKKRYGGTITSRYNYTLDVSRFPDEATRGIVQFKAAGVTTIINACDPYSTLFMTQAAQSQAYRPEWYIIGVAAQDVDTVARLFDQSQVDGHLFGMSQLGDQSKLWGPKGEPGITYKRITGKDIPAGTDGGYFYLLQIFNFLQSAGPNLTPENMDKGVHSLPPMGLKTFAVGYYSYRDDPSGLAGGHDHTGIDDSREIYWCGTCTSQLDGNEGTYIETMGGKRFRNNEWPAEEPPVYPAGYRETFK